MRAFRLSQPLCEPAARRYLSAFLALLFAGCTTIQRDIGAELPENLDALSAAQDYREVLDILGPPRDLAVSEHGLTFLYENARLVERQVGISIEIQDYSLLKAVVGRGDADRDAIIVHFDREGRLLAHSRKQWSELIGRGGGIQFILAMLPVTDHGILTSPETAHTWGAQLLEADLPIGLNRGSSPDTSPGVIELRGTPWHAGQRSLELR